MSSITTSLERSLQNISLHHHNQHCYVTSGSDNSKSGGGSGGSGGGGGDSGSVGGFEENEDDSFNSTCETTYELNSHISLPYYWEQCLDLKTGELYYINWKTGMKATEDPRTARGAELNVDFDYSDYDNYYSSSDSEDSESPPPFSRDDCINKIGFNNYDNNQSNVLVVGGCKSCMMYFMLPRQVEDCPKCSGQLLHFDKSEDASSP